MKSLRQPCTADDSANLRNGEPAVRYRSSVCSNISPPGSATQPAAGVTNRIGPVLDQLAATACQDESAMPGLGRQLAAAWAVTAAAGPDLAA
jgi:hypothetical protein